MNNVIEVNNLNKNYFTNNKKLKVLDSINFNVKKGEIVTLLGSSGCGKSTILSILSNVDKDYSGKINLFNNKISYMLQTDCLLPWLTIKDNAILGLKLTKQDNDNNIKKVDNLLKKYKLYDFRDKYPKNLSGGMKQRVG